MTAFPALLALLAGARLLVINETLSLPTGLYVRAPGPVTNGAVVTLAPPPSARAYLAGLGAPADARLLKRVAAAGGDMACRRGGYVMAGAARLAVRTHDRRGAALPAWRACRRLGPDEIFVVGDTATSFDGRYFGPVRRADVEGPYRLVLRW